MFGHEHAEVPHQIALWAAVVSIAVKELLYRVTIKVGEKYVNPPLLLVLLLLLLFVAIFLLLLVADVALTFVAGDIQVCL